MAGSFLENIQYIASFFVLLPLPMHSCSLSESLNQGAACYMESRPLHAVHDSTYGGGWSTYAEIILQLSRVSFLCVFCGRTYLQSFDAGALHFVCLMYEYIPKYQKA
jgi:hypothetical protein